ncbi:MAG: hypothetical protein IJL94_00375, partial [Erysipelotrichaceae bacterium]|nr:hypothetical protein [Erysipelotrichaceae bacterium]
MKRIICFLMALLMTFSLIGCDKKDKVPEYEDFPDTYVDALPANAEDGLTLCGSALSQGQLAVRQKSDLPACRPKSSAGSRRGGSRSPC